MKTGPDFRKHFTTTSCQLCSRFEEIELYFLVSILDMVQWIPITINTVLLRKVATMVVADSWKRHVFGLFHTENTTVFSNMSKKQLTCIRSLRQTDTFVIVMYFDRRYKRLQRKVLENTESMLKWHCAHVQFHSNNYVWKLRQTFKVYI